MKKLDDYQKYLPILSKAKLFEGIPLEHYPQIFNFLQASILSFEKDELIQHLGEPLLYSGIVLDGTVEGSFINENYSKINMNHFERGRSFAEALACVQTPYSPIQLKALTNCTIMLINLKGIISGSSCPCSYQLNLTTNMLKILASQNVFSNLKLRIANQKSLRDRILIYLHSLAPDSEGYLHDPFTQTALAEFLVVNRSALSPLPHTLYAISQQFYSNASSSTDFSVSADLCNALISSSDSEMGTFDINPSAPTILGIDRTTSLIPYSPSIIVEIGSIERSSLIIASHILFTDIAIP